MKYINFNYIYNLTFILALSYINKVFILFRLTKLIKELFIKL